MTLEDITVKKHVNNASGHGQSRPSGPTPPKMGTFNGKNQWLPYFLQFSLIENKYEWSDQDRLDKLIECLRDRVLKNFTRPKFVQDNYKLTCKKIEERFGCKYLPNVIRRQLQELRQRVTWRICRTRTRSSSWWVSGYIGWLHTDSDYWCLPQR